MKTSSGNALFLILIAVALFAALSYAVTNSGRGGSGIDKERAEILASQIFQEVARLRSGILRLKVIGGYDQVLFDDSAETTSGTCYSGSNTTTPCHTIGLFNSTTGNAPPVWLQEYRSPDFPSETQTWSWQSRQVIINGSDVGTSAPDTILFLKSLAPEICDVITTKMTGSSTRAVTTTDAGAGAGIATVSYTHLTLPTKA